MPTKQKAKTIEELSKKLAKSPVSILTDYRGLTVAEMSQLRKQLRQAGVRYEVAKNTLARYAAQQAGIRALDSYLAGPTAIAFGAADVSEPAKLLIEYERGSRVFKIKGGLLGTRVLSAEDVKTLAALPPREVLVAKVLGGMNAPIASLVGVLGGPMRAFVQVLRARQEQLAAAGGS